MPAHKHEWKYGGVKYVVCGIMGVKAYGRVVYLDWFFCVKCLEAKYMVIDRTGNSAEKVSRYGASPVREDDELSLLGDLCTHDEVWGWVLRERQP